MADWRDTIKRQKVTGGDWQKTIVKSQPSEQEFLEEATKKADIGYEERKPGKLESFAEGVTKGLTLGYNREALARIHSTYHGTPYDESYRIMREREREIEAENPGILNALNAGDLVGTMVTGAALPGVLAPARGAKLAAQAAQSGTKAATRATAGALGKDALQMAGIGAVEGYGRTEGDRADRATGAITSGAIGGALPVVGPIVSSAAGKVAGTAKDVASSIFPGSKTAPKWLNTLVAKGSKILGAEDDTADRFKTMLEDPDRLKKALVSQSEKMDQIPEMERRLGESFQQINQKVDDVYRKTQGEAYAKNVEDPIAFATILTDSAEIVRQALNKAESFPDHYSEPTKAALRRSLKSLELNDPKIQGSEKLKKMISMLENAIQSGDQETINRTIQNIDDDLIKIGGALHRSRQKVQEALKFDAQGKINLHDDEAELLNDVRLGLQNQLKVKAPGAEKMTESDTFYHEFKKHAEPFEEHFKGRGPSGLSAKNVADFMSGSGSPYVQSRVRAYQKSAKDFLEKNNISSKELDDSINEFGFLKDKAMLGRLGGQTGEKTGRSNLPFTMIGGGTGMVGATIAAGPLAGIGVAVLTAMTLPSASPIKYLKGLNSVRNKIEQVGEDAAAAEFGKYWPAVRNAVYRRTASEDDVNESRQKFLSEMKGLRQDEPNNQSAQMVPEKIRDYLGGSPDTISGPNGNRNTPEAIREFLNRRNTGS